MCSVGIGTAFMLGLAVTQAHAAYVRGNPVTKVEIQPDGYLLIDVDGNFPVASTVCEDKAGARSRYPISDERTKAWLQIALESLRSRKFVVLNFDGVCDGGPGTLGHPIFTDFGIVP